MTARNNMMTWAALTAGAVLLTGTSVARADPHGPRTGRGWARPVPVAHRGGPRRVVVVEPRRHEPRSGLGISVQFGPDWYVARPASHWVPGYYTTRTEQVLVEPGHYEDRWVDAVTETRYPSNGPSYTVVLQEGHRERVWVADRYETRVIREWVPEHWVRTAPVVYRDSGPRVTIGGHIRF